KLSKAQREQFILPHLSKGSRGPATTLSFHAIFNYILCALYLGCQWKNLPIEKDQHGRREIHPTSIDLDVHERQGSALLSAIVTLARALDTDVAAESTHPAKCEPRRSA